MPLTTSTSTKLQPIRLPEEHWMHYGIDLRDFATFLSGLLTLKVWAACAFNSQTTKELLDKLQDI